MAIVTFDFDDTLLTTVLTEDGFVEPGGPNEETLEALRRHVEAGDEVHIVTSRIETLETERAGVTVAGFVEAHGLPVKGIHFTNGHWKVEAIQRLGSVKHFDDDLDELDRLQGICECVLVPVHESWL